jgi:hypothetical protein
MSDPDMEQQWEADYPARQRWTDVSGRWFTVREVYRHAMDRTYKAELHQRLKGWAVETVDAAWDYIGELEPEIRRLEELAYPERCEGCEVASPEHANHAMHR